MVLVHPDPPGRFFSHHPDIFLRGLLPVGPLGKDDVHIFIRHTGQVQFIDHMDHIF